MAPRQFQAAPRQVCRHASLRRKATCGAASIRAPGSRAMGSRVTGSHAVRAWAAAAPLHVVRCCNSPARSPSSPAATPCGSAPSERRQQLIENRQAAGKARERLRANLKGDRVRDTIKAGNLGDRTVGARTAGAERALVRRGKGDRQLMLRNQRAGRALGAHAGGARAGAGDVRRPLCQPLPRRRPAPLASPAPSPHPCHRLARPGVLAVRL